MTERPTSDRITAYSRGLRRAWLFQLFVGALAVVTVLASTIYIAQKREELAGIEADKEKAIEAQIIAEQEAATAEAQLKTARAETDLRAELNFDLSDIGITASRAGTDQIALLTALFKIENVLKRLPDTPEWSSTRIDLFRLRINLLEADRQVNQAIFQQGKLVELYASQADGDKRTAELNAANGVLDLAALLCRAKERPSALRLLGACNTVIQSESLGEQGNFLESCDVAMSRSSQTGASSSPNAWADNACSGVVAQIVGDFESRLERARETPITPAVTPRATPSPQPPSTAVPPETPDVETGPDTGKEETSAEADFTIRNVFLHIREESQRSEAIAIGEALCRTGRYSVPGIERVAAPRGYPDGARLIYYHTEQADAARAIAESLPDLAVQSSASALSKQPESRLYQGRNLPRDRVEIWFDPQALPAGDAQSADPRFRCSPV